MTPASLIAYKLLFNEEYDPGFIPNPNKPEDGPRSKAERLLKYEKAKKFWDGPGNVLFEIWKVSFRDDIRSLFEKVDDCSCGNCNKIRSIKAKIELITEAQIILTEGEIK
jgi:hypothetical protein